MAPASVDAREEGGEAPRQLARVLGGWDIALLTIGAVIGSGIFLVPGHVAVATHMSRSTASVVWGLGALLSLCGAITYAELARIRPVAGGLYVYIRDGYGRVAAFVFGWMSLFVNTSGTVAALTAAAATILHASIPGSIPAGWLAVGLTTGLGLINLLPARRGGDVQGWTSGVKFGAVLLFSVLLILRAPGSHGGTVAAAPGAPMTYADFTVALVAVLWAFEGWQYVTCAAGEARDVKRSVALGLILGVLALGVVFLLTSIAVTSWLGTTELTTSTNVIETALRKADLPVLALLVRILLPIAILSAAHATLLTGSRVVYAMAKDSLLPSRCAAVSTRTGIPTIAVMSCTVCASVLAGLGSFDTLLAYVVVTSWAFYGLAGFAVFRIPAQHRARGRWVRGAAAVFCTGAAGVMLFGILTGPPSARYGLVIVALGWIGAAVWFRSSRRDTE